MTKIDVTIDIETKKQISAEIETVNTVKAREVGKRVVIRIRREIENTRVDERTDIKTKTEIKIGKDGEIVINRQENVQGRLFKDNILLMSYWHYIKKLCTPRIKNCPRVMHLSMFSPRDGGTGNPRRFDSK